MAGRPAGRTWFPPANPSGLSELDVAAGMVVGQGGSQPPLLSAGADPVAVLEAQARALLAKPPCVIAFSGGRDSSVLLATFVHVAREEGLPQPIAVTARWDEDEASDEAEWQEHVVASVGADHWEILRPGTDLDLLGHHAISVLGSLGLMWPAPAYAFAPMVHLAAGGTFVSGEGGDEAFGLWPYGRLWATVRRRQLPSKADLVAFATGCAPRPLRRRRWQHVLPPYQTWLRRDAYVELGFRLADDQADDPLRWDRYQQVSRSRRAVDLTLDTLDRMSARSDARFVAPFLDRGFLAALARWGGRLGRGDRTAVMTALFGDVLSASVLARTSKASFGGVFWGPESRRFAEEWDGTGLPTGLVDVEALRRAWLAEVPVYGAALPLHAAWLRSDVAGRLRTGTESEG